MGERGGRETCTIGADLGTTNAKAIAFDARGREIARAETSVPLLHHGGDAAEQDPRAVYDGATGVLVQCARAAWQHGYVVERVGLSAAMHSIVPVSADGTPLTNALTWMDTRAGPEAAALWQSEQGKGIYARTGTPIHPMSPLPKLIWIREQQPQIFQTAYKFVSLKEWVWYRWFGEWAVDASLASATGLYNLRERAWDAEALAVAGIDADRLSRLVPTTYVRRGVRDKRLFDAGIASDAAFNVGASDGVLANLGVGAVDASTMVLTIGTSLAARSGTRVPVTDPATQLFCYVLDADRYIAGGPSNNGGIVLDWLYHKVLSGGGAPAAGTDGFADLIAAAERAPTGPLLCLPYVAGERAPLWAGGAKAVFFGLQLDDTAATLIRAAIEGMILNAYWIASSLFAQLGKPEQMLATGKVLETDWIRRLTADVFGLPVRFRGAVDASVLGAATLANIAAGLWTWDEAIARESQEQASTAYPTREHDTYQRKFARFQRLAQALTGDLADLYLSE
ncbi:MAG TPA: gluconokinase [Ktedonobacterales bacterium]|nr:gluconokinase [Ktedonobacterales bacterium]